ncbi:MAG TPA: helix-turn-helix domain-containing protein [Chloroflexota bacterium]|nr:helix-turn-helix domain-containing protein [Chloroflexota bacterium]
MTRSDEVVLRSLLERVLERLEVLEQRLGQLGPKGLYDLDQAAVYLAISRSEIKRLLERGELRSVHIGRRRLLPHSALEDFVAERLVG